MLASTALISRTPNPVWVLRCFGRNDPSTTPGAGTLPGRGGGFDKEDIVVRSEDESGNEERQSNIKTQGEIGGGRGGR